MPTENEILNCINLRRILVFYSLSQIKLLLNTEGHDSFRSIHTDLVEIIHYNI